MKMFTAIKFTLDVYIPFLWYLLYRCIRVAAIPLQKVWWRITDTQRRENKAQIKTIVLRGKLSLLAFANEHNFFSLQHTFANSEYILRDSVTLYAVTKTDAIFVELPPGIDLYNSDISVFTFVTQYRHAVRTINMSHDDFNLLASKVGDPKFPVVILPNTGRCGSTLVCQIFEAGGVQADSEPAVFRSLMGLRRTLPGEQYHRLLQSTVRLLCKPRLKEVQQIVMKLSSNDIMHCRDISQLFPEMTFLYLYRDPLEVMRSFGGYIVISPTRIIYYFIANRYLRRLVPGFYHYMAYATLGDESETAWMRDPDVSRHPSQYTSMHICWTAFKYMDLLENHARVKALKYNDLINDPQRIVSKVFEYCGLPLSKVPQALEAFGKDSQRGTPLARGNRDTSSTDRTLDDVRDFDDYCLALGVPVFSNGGRLPGTIF